MIRTLLLFCALFLLAGQAWGDYPRSDSSKSSVKRDTLDRVIVNQSQQNGCCGNDKDGGSDGISFFEYLGRQIDILTINIGVAFSALALILTILGLAGYARFSQISKDIEYQRKLNQDSMDIFSRETKLYEKEIEQKKGDFDKLFIDVDNKKIILESEMAGVLVLKEKVVQETSFIRDFIKAEAISKGREVAEPIKAISEALKNNLEINEAQKEEVTRFRKILEFLLSAGEKLSPNQYYDLSVIQTMTKEHLDLEAAKISIVQATLLDPKNLTYWFWNGYVHYKLNYVDEAIYAYNRVIELDKNSEGAYFNLGNIFKDAKDYEKAIFHYNKAIDINPQFHHAFNNLGICYDSKQDPEFDKAINAYINAINIKGDKHETWYNLAIVYCQIKPAKFVKALEAIGEALKYDKENELYLAEKERIIARKKAAESGDTGA